VRRPDIEALYGRITAVEDASCRGDDPRFDKHSSGSRGFVEVEVTLKDGRTGRTRVDHPPGHPRRELTWDDLRAKFIDCARQSQHVSAGAANQAFDAIRKLEQAADIRQVVNLLQG
jgi:2-methylcitrate dehydratase PrpD